MIEGGLYAGVSMNDWDRQRIEWKQKMDVLEHKLHQKEDELERLRDVVAKLSKCWRLKTTEVTDRCVSIDVQELVQDCPVVPGMELWTLAESWCDGVDMPARLKVVSLWACYKGVTIEVLNPYNEPEPVDIKDCYDSPEAAVFAAERLFQNKSLMKQ